MDCPETRIKRLENENIKVTRIAEPQLHIEKNLVDVNYQILILNKKTGILKSINETHTMRYFFDPEIALFTESIFDQIDAQAENWNKQIILKKSTRL